MKKEKKLYVIAAFFAAVGLIFTSCGDGGGGGGDSIIGENCNGTSCLNEGRRIGDDGPGGGSIFYHLCSGFNVVGEGKYYYMEVDSGGIGYKHWASEGNNLTNIAGTSKKIGWGKENTRLILKADSTAPAALACKSYRGGEQTDWFIPSLDELNKLYELYKNEPSKMKNKDGIISGGIWSSSQKDNINAWIMFFSQKPANSQSDTYKTDGNSYVRAVRYF